MKHRGAGLAALLAVVGLSIVFGMLLGSKLNAPPVTFAAPLQPLQLEPAIGGPGNVNFADVVEDAIPGVVTVRNDRRVDAEDEDDSPQFFEDPDFWRFFGMPEPQERRRSPQRRPRPSEGSGFVISADGYVLTNNHVVDQHERVQVTMHDGTTHDADVVGTDPSIDLALLKVDADDPFDPLPLGDSDGVRIGEWVIAIGNPHEFDSTVTVGVVSGKGREVPIGDTDRSLVRFIQTDAAINFGNSGGPLIDSRGNVIGINTAIRRTNLAEGIGFALPINQVRDVLPQLQQRGYVSRGYIGININNLDPEGREYYGIDKDGGAQVVTVIENSPADEAGLEKNDIIIEVDGEKIASSDALVAEISSRQPGDRVGLTVIRGRAGESRTLRLKATLTDREEALEDQGRRTDRRRERVEEDPEESTGLGMTVEELTSRRTRELGLRRGFEGVLVTDVEFDSSAAAKGIQPGMLIAAINDRPVTDTRDYSRIISKLTPGSSCKIDMVVIGADGEPQDFDVFVRVPSSD